MNGGNGLSGGLGLCDEYGFILLIVWKAASIHTNMNMAKYLGSSHRLLLIVYFSHLLLLIT